MNGRARLLRTRVPARPGLPFVEPRFSPLIYRFARLASPLFLRLSEGVRRVGLEGADRLLDAYRGFYRGEFRLILAFHHASVHDPPVLIHLFSRLLPREARRRRQRGRIGGPAHAHFLYGRDVLQWARGGASWLIPGIGGIPVRNQRSDVRGSRGLRRHLAQGAFPVALAPEGQVTYHNHRLGPLQGGTARLALWCLEDLEREGRTGEVLILPLSVTYTYRNPERTLERVVELLVAQAGCRRPAAGPWPERLLDLTGQLIAILERFYGRFFRLEEAPAGEPAPPGDSGALQDRLLRVCDAALRAAERSMKLPASGDLLKRVFTVRQKGADLVFRDDLPAGRAVSPLERTLADRVADEAYLALRHNELADVLEYVRPEYIGPPASINRCVEYALNLADIVNRLRGGHIGSRYSPPGKEAGISIGRPLAVRELTGGQDGGGAVPGPVPGTRRDRAAALMTALRSALEELCREG